MFTVNAWHYCCGVVCLLFPTFSWLCTRNPECSADCGSLSNAACEPSQRCFLRLPNHSLLWLSQCCCFCSVALLRATVVTCSCLRVSFFRNGLVFGGDWHIFTLAVVLLPLYSYSRCLWCHGNQQRKFHGQQYLYFPAWLDYTCYD